MKLQNLLFSIAICLFAAMVVSSCSDKTSEQADETAVEETYAYTAAHICPMHCEGSGSDTPGKCPSCKMDYVKNEKKSSEDHEHEGHDHGHDHEGHDHEGHDHEGHDH
jgi:predicted nucleic acid binding AN1-type Zn finger protein